MCNSYFRTIIEQSKDDISLLSEMYDVPNVLLDDYERGFIKGVKNYFVKHGVAPDWQNVIVYKNPELSIVLSDPTPLSFQREKFYDNKRKQLSYDKLIEAEGLARNGNLADLPSTLESIRQICSTDINKQYISMQGVSIDDLRHSGYFIKTGIQQLDDDLGGLGSGETACLFARPGMGKTNFSIYEAWKMSHWAKIGYVTCEASMATVRSRFACIEGGINPRRIRGEMTEQTENELNNALSSLVARKAEILIYTGVNDLDRIDNFVLQDGDKFDVLFVDAVYKMDLGANATDEYARVAKVVMGLVDKNSKSWKKPLFLSSQINRAGGGKDVEPDLTNVAFTDAFARELDLGLVLTQHPESNNGKIFTVIKDRNGSILGQKIISYFDPVTMRYDFPEPSKDFD